MKRSALFLMALCVFFSCKKDNQTNNTNTGPKPGKPIKVTTNFFSPQNWNLLVFENDANSNALVYQKDTMLTGNITFQFTPHLNDMVTITNVNNSSSPISLGMQVFDGPNQLGPPDPATTTSQTWKFFAQ